MSSEPSETLYDVYLCSYYDQSSPVSRHYTTGYSVCKRLATLEESKVNTILSLLNLDVRRTRGDVVIADVEAVNTVIEKLKSMAGVQGPEEPENAYVYVVFARKRRL